MLTEFSFCMFVGFCDRFVTNYDDDDDKTNFKQYLILTRNLFYNWKKIMRWPYKMNLGRIQPIGRVFETPFLLMRANGAVVMWYCEGTIMKIRRGKT